MAQKFPTGVQSPKYRIRNVSPTSNCYINPGQLSRVPGSGTLEHNRPISFLNLHFSAFPNSPVLSIEVLTLKSLSFISRFETPMYCLEHVHPCATASSSLESCGGVLAWVSTEPLPPASAELSLAEGVLHHAGPGSLFTAFSWYRSRKTLNMANGFS